MDKLVAMRTFVRVVGANSFTGAARQLGRSKARVSQSILALEQDLGVVLLRRTTRSLRLTDEGRLYYERCAQLLDELDALESSLKEERAALEGTLRVTAPPGFASRYLNVLTSDFFTQHPRISIDLDLTHRMVDLVAEGIDVAVRVTEPRDSSLVVRKLASVAIIAVAAPDYLKRCGRPTRPTDLKKHSCLVDSNFRHQQKWRFTGRQRVTVSGPVRVNSPTAIRSLTLAGHGIALVPRFVVVEDLKARRLIEVLKGKVDYAWAIYAVYPRREHLPRRVRSYMDHLAKAFGGGSGTPLAVRD